jgi:hypothetical protein
MKTGVVVDWVNLVSPTLFIMLQFTKTNLYITNIRLIANLKLATPTSMKPILFNSEKYIPYFRSLHNSLIQYLQDYILDCAIHTLDELWTSAISR